MANLFKICSNSNENDPFFWLSKLYIYNNDFNQRRMKI